MLKSNNLIPAIIALLFLSSCSVTHDFYQVYKVVPDPGIKNTADKLIYEDSNCSISYNFWDEDGNAGFVFYNKTDSAIYLHMDQSFYVINGMAFDYFRDRIYTKSSSKSYAVGKSVAAGRAVTGVNDYQRIQTNSLAAGVAASNASSSGHSVAYHEPRVLIIPSKTSKKIDEYGVLNDIYRHCDLSRWPSEKSKVTLQFNKDNSPFTFGNRLAYSIGGKGVINKVENRFYISEIVNYSFEGLHDYERTNFCEEKSTVRTWKFKFSPPDMFYNTYPYIMGGLNR